MGHTVAHVRLAATLEFVALHVGGSKAKVGDLDSVLAVRVLNKKVFGLEVTMGDSTMVDLTHAFEDLLKD